MQDIKPGHYKQNNLFFSNFDKNTKIKSLINHIFSAHNFVTSCVSLKKKHKKQLKKQYMKNLLTLICFLFLIKGTAQIKTNFSIETASGYEENIFKSPKSFFENGVLKNKNDLYRSSFLLKISTYGK